MSGTKAWTLAVAFSSALVGATGCHLLAGLDIETYSNGGAGGTTTSHQGGGSTSTSASTQGGGGTTSSTPMCVDPAADCPAPSGECKVAICDQDGNCAEDNVTDGQNAATQSGGDCKKNVCQGDVGERRYRSS